MNKIARFVIWICSKFTRDEIEQIIQGLSDILADRNPNVKPKDDFKEKHPNYRNFFVDPNAPLPAVSKPHSKPNWKELLNKYTQTHGAPLKPVGPKNSATKVPENTACRICGAPQNTFTLTMEKNGLKSNVRFVLLYHKSTRVIA